MNDVVLYQRSAVDIRRELAQMPAFLDGFSISERSIFLASVEKPFSGYTSSELATELNAALKWIAKDVGYRETDEKERQYLVIRLVKIFQQYYPTLTVKDLQLAFEMVLIGELDEYLPKNRDGMPDRGHYQQFNAEYICKILNAYRAKRAGVLKRANDMAPKKEPVRNTSKDLENANAVKKQCIDAFLFYKYRGRLPQMSVVNEIVCYDTLVAAGLAEELTITGDEQKMVLQGESARMAKKEVREPKYQSFVRKRRNALRSVFGWMADNEIQITDYLKINGN